MVRRTGGARPVGMYLLLFALASASALGLGITVSAGGARGSFSASSSRIAHIEAVSQHQHVGSSGTGAAPYPAGDCPTECSADPAARMAHCPAEGGIPATQCQALNDSQPGLCPSLRYPDAFNPEAYCMPRFDADCSHPDNFGCSKRCALYLIVNYNCVADAYFLHNSSFNAHCVACNMCWDRSHEQRQAAQQAPYALVWARGPTGALFVNHFLVLPLQACSGIESTIRGCTDAAGEFLWANAFHEAHQLGFNYSGGAPTWALWMNAPNRRGVHQMHIHISHFDSQRSLPDVPRDDWLARKVAAAPEVSADPGTPTRILGEGFYDRARFSHTPLGRPPKNWARAYAVHVASDNPATDLGTAIKPFELARQIAAASDLPSHGYGIAVMPRTLRQVPGLLVAVLWSTSDSEQLDETELQGDPIGYSHTCHQYIAAAGAGQQRQRASGGSAAAAAGERQHPGVV